MCGLCVQPIPILSAFVLCHPYIPLSNLIHLLVYLYNTMIGMAALLLYFLYLGKYSPLAMAIKTILRTLQPVFLCGNYRMFHNLCMIM